MRCPENEEKLLPYKAEPECCATFAVCPDER